VSSLEQIGQKLKNARESRGLTLGQIYDKTKIPTSNLEAIETGDAEQLPEPVYVAGFIKRYADLLGLNGRSLSEEYKQYIEDAHDNGRGIFGALGGQKSKSVAVQSQPVITPSISKVNIMEPPRPGLLKTFFWPAVLIVLVLVGMGYVMMYQNSIYMNQHDPILSSLRESSSRFNSVQPSTPLTPTTSATPTTATPASTDKDCRISLQASQHVWLEVKSVSTGESVFTGTMEAGDRRDFQDNSGLKVRAGNGGSLNVSYQGKHETFGSAGKPADRVFMAANGGSAGATASIGDATSTTADGSVVKPISTTTVKKPKAPAVRKPKPAPSATRLDAAPSRYIPGESVGGSRSIGVPYRYTEGRLDSE
jgi:cytoskeletal protein RodZ